MRQNRLSQRLKSKLDSFGFDALIKGVSTLVEEAPADEEDRPPVPEAAEIADSPAGSVLPPLELPSGVTVSELLLDIEADEQAELVPAPTAPEPVARESALKPSAVATVAVELEPAVALRPVEAPVARVVETLHSAPEPLREAIHALSCRLSQEVGRMAAALEQRDAEEAGFYLAHVNQILELLHTLDARGDMARSLGVDNAPPRGRSWPLTAWTVVEFAESPFSALLPADAGETFVREVIYAAWGISVN